MNRINVLLVHSLGAQDEPAFTALQSRRLVFFLLPFFTSNNFTISHPHFSSHPNPQLFSQDPDPPLMLWAGGQGPPAHRKAIWSAPGFVD